MQDRVPTKPNRYAVYDDAHNFLRYEYHERADEPTQVGDALNKANLLPDAVATALGLTGNPQVKDALNLLSHAPLSNRYSWKKYNAPWHEVKGDSRDVAFGYFMPNSSMQITVANSIDISNDGVPTLREPYSITITQGTSVEKLYYKAGGITGVVQCSGTVSRTSDASGYTFTGTGKQITTNRQIEDYIETITVDDNPNAYPQNDFSTPYYYYYLGSEVDQLVPQIEIGTYTGTGLYGSDNPTAIELGREPKLLIVKGQVYINATVGTESYTLIGVSPLLSASYYKASGSFNSPSNERTSTVIMNNWGTSPSWYSLKTAEAQMNTSGNEYVYISLS